MKTRHLTVGLAATIVGAAVAAVPLVAGASDAPTSSTQNDVQSLASTPARVSLLTRAATNADQPTPALLKLRAQGSSTNSKGEEGSPTLANPDATFRIPRSDANHSLAIVDDADGTCILVAHTAGGASSSCGPGLSQVPAMGSADVVGDGRWRVAFLLPDGVDTFNIHLRDGDVKAVPVRDNVVDTIVDGGGPTGFAWIGIDGAPQKLGSTVADEQGGRKG